MDFANLIPEIATRFGIAPSTLIFILFVTVKGANMIARYIPDDATGWRGALRQVCTFIGLHVASRVTSGITMTDVVRAAIGTPPIGAKAAAIADSDLSPPRAGETATRLVDAGLLHREGQALDPSVYRDPHPKIEGDALSDIEAPTPPAQA